MTDQERFEMYSKLTKKELIWMLIEVNKNCDLLNLQIFKSEPRFYEPIITSTKDDINDHLKKKSGKLCVYNPETDKIEFVDPVYKLISDIKKY